jgi:hypothetical protein
MSLDKKDIEMMAVSIPVVDWWDIREEIDQLNDTVNRLKKIVEALILLHREERVKTWEMILQKMMEQEQKKGNHNGNRTG